MRMRGNTARGQLGEPRTAAAGVGILVLSHEDARQHSSGTTWGTAHGRGRRRNFSFDPGALGLEFCSGSVRGPHGAGREPTQGNVRAAAAVEVPTTSSW